MKIIIVQLSDIHIKDENDLELLIDRAVNIGSVINTHIDSITNCVILFCITGDIAYSGKEDQYTIASLMLEEIIAKITNQYNNILINIAFTPGNHDCDFTCPENGIRDILLKDANIIDNIDNESILRNCMAVQKEFFKFVDEWEAKGYSFLVKDNSLVSINQLKIGHLHNLNIIIQIVNSSWASQKKEVQGQLKFKTPKYDKYQECDLVITMLHHDFDWFDRKSKIDITDFCNDTSDIILVGHDHYENYVYSKNYDESSNYHIKANKLYDESKKNESAFNILKIDLDNNIQYFYTYNWDGNKYTPIINTKAQDFIRNIYSNGGYKISNEMHVYLEDIEVDINSKYRKNILLSDVYVYPAITIEKEKSPDIISVLREKNEIITKILEGKNIVVNGEREYGKTAFLKKLFLDFYDMKYLPIFLDPNMLISGDSEILNEIIIREYEKQYIGISGIEILQNDKEKKVCLIDNFNEIVISDNGICKIIEYLSLKFEIVIITFSSGIELQYSLKNFKSSKLVNDKFTKFNISRFRTYNRQQLVEKWLLLEDSFVDTNNIIFEKKCKDKMNQIDIIMKNGFFNKTALDTLLILSYLDNAENMNSFNTKYSFIYEYYIMEKIKLIAGDDTNEALMYKTILEQIAYDIYTETSNNGIIEEKFLIKVISNYLEEHRGYKGKIIDIIKKLIECRIIIEKEKTYRFLRNYMFYYFTGSFILNQMAPVDKIGKINMMFQDLSLDANFNIALFLAYKMNVEFEILPILENISNGLLNDFKTFKYEEQRSMLEKIDIDIAAKVDEKYIIPTNEEINDRRKNELINEDNIEIEEELASSREDQIEEETEKNKVNPEFIKALRLIELSGEILKNYSTAIKSGPITKIIDLMYQSHLKTLGYLCQEVGKMTNEIISFVEDEIKNDSDESKRTKNNMIQAINVFISKFWCMLLGSANTYMAYSLENERLNEDIGIYNSDISSDAFKMIYVEYLIRISKVTLPVTEINSCFQGKNKMDVLSRYVLKSNIAKYLTSYQYDVNDKKAICSLLEFDINKVLLEEHKKTLTEINDDTQSVNG